MKGIKFFISTLLILIFINHTPCSALEDSEIENVKASIETIYSKRNELFITGKISELPEYYNSKTKFGTWALEHEVKRIKYLKKWSEERDIIFTSITSELQFRKITPYKTGAKVTLNEYYKFNYSYNNEENPEINTFGVGLIHSIELIKKNDQWIINWDWYTDCFEDALKGFNVDFKDMAESYPKIYSIPPLEKPNLLNLENTSENQRRIKAVNYADKYCGIVWASNNPSKYNKKYKNYTGIGGNCTNYVSQCLGDKQEGAALKQQGGWYCNYSKYGQAEGSPAWVNADAFKNYLFYSGKGKLIKRGSFKDLLPKEGSNENIFSKLDYGDVICYAKGSDIDHFAIVTGFDSRGYPLINSHTTDRYRVPFDLGWGDKNISFYLIKIRY